MKKILIALLAFLALASASTPALSNEAAPPKTPVSVLEFSGVINPIASEYIGGTIAALSAEGRASLIVVKLDTPGGLDTSMRIIVKEIMASKIPVAVYVSPSGSRAASAGTFIAMAAHISAMAPGTSQGSAHPVNLGEGKMDDTMKEKVENDAAAYIRSIAKERGRNAEWAEKAVRNSVSIGERDALAEHVIDIVAKDMDDLIRQANGRTVKIGNKEVVLSFAAPDYTVIEMSQRQKFLDTISNPTVAYILLMIGFYGLFFELANPGVVLPGVIGGICLILGFYSMQSLPINYAAIFLLILAVIMFVAELFVVSHGALTIGGVVAMVLGAVMLIDAPVEWMKVNLLAVVPVAAAMGGLFFLVLGYGIFFRPKRVPTGVEGLTGLDGEALTELAPLGQVEVDGEIWEARAARENIPKGSAVTVERKEGRLLVVRAAKAAASGG